MMTQDIKWIKCSSSNIYAYAYDKTKKTLYMQFNYGDIYAYYDVPHDVYDGLVNAGSKGKYHAACIKYSYKYEKIK